jgi:hypothetical protein
MEDRRSGAGGVWADPGLVGAVITEGMSLVEIFMIWRGSG